MKIFRILAAITFGIGGLLVSFSLIIRAAGWFF